MNYQGIMQVVDFSALLQLAFTLYAAFIAVEYAKSFTSVVINRFYDFKGDIANRINGIKKLCRNEELQSIESDDYFNDGEGMCLLMEYRNKVSECETKAKDDIESLYKFVDKNTEYRIFRYISVLMMLFCFTVLLVGGMYRTYPSQIMHFLLTFTAFCTLFTIAAWVLATSDYSRQIGDKTLLVSVFILYGLSLLCSVGMLFFHPVLTTIQKECLWAIGVVVAALIPFLNFLFFFILVTIQMKKMKSFFELTYRPFEVDCRETGKTMEKLLNHQELRNKVEDAKKNGTGQDRT